jgi:8-oxo-dGTP pyrophosphatase MutT (NUDIX family)
MDLPRLNLPTIARVLAAPPPAGTSDYDLNPAVRATLPPGRRLRPASVLVPIVERGPRLNVILTRRAALLKHHPGQVAFPGGKQDPADADPRAAALREAREEIGLAADQVEILGAIDTHETVTSFTVTPFVGVIAPGFRPLADPAEVEEVFEVPLAFLIDPANLQVHRRRWNGVWRQYYAIPYGPHYIWGATARMVKSLADRLGPV